MEEQRTVTPKIYGALASAMAEIGSVGKNREVTDGLRYKYRSIIDIYNEAHLVLSKFKIITTMDLLSRADSVRQAKSGSSMYHCLCTFKVTFWAEDGSSVSSTLPSEGLDTGDKGSNKAISFAHKNALITALVLPYDDMTDGDAERTEHQNPPKQGAQPPPLPPKDKAPPAQKSGGYADRAKAAPPKTVKLEDFVVTLGKNKGKKLCEIDEQDLRGFINWAEMQEKPTDELVMVAEKMTEFLMGAKR